MKANFSKTLNVTVKGTVLALSGTLVLGGIGCKKKDNNTTTPPSYQQVNLVSDTAGYGAARTDALLGNAWGIAIGPTGAFWISANHSGSSVIYGNDGAQLRGPITTPFGGAHAGASPTGVVYNSTTDFLIPGLGASTFIYATENGVLTAWNSSTGDSSMLVASRSAVSAVYKGLTIANDGASNFIYAADFHNAKIDVYDRNFAYVTTKPFTDPNIPAGYAPFNIKNIGGQLYVTYAKQLGPDNKDDQAGAGNGYVDIYTPAGVLVKRFASQGMLNSPWGITQAPTAFGQPANAVLIGNFGDGHINVYDVNGNYQTQLMTNGTVISIPGLWDITFNTVSPADPNRLYFTAGPASEAHGLFGYLKKM